KKAPKKGSMPTEDDWEQLRSALATFDFQHVEMRPKSASKVSYLQAVPSLAADAIQLSAQVLSLRDFDTSSIIERDSYVDDVMKLWQAGKRLIVTRALSGTGKTRAFYLLLKRITDTQHHFPFYYLLKASSERQTPEDYLDHLLNTLATDLRLSSPEEKPV